jgi:hypothetical protein
MWCAEAAAGDGAEIAAVEEFGQVGCAGEVLDLCRGND